MSRGGFVFIVVALLIGATIPALFSTIPTRGYPASPHYGDAFIGKFWLEEMNITLDTANSSGYDIAKMVKGHVKAQNDWIVYDANNSIVANYSVQLSDEHPKFVLILWLEVYEVRSDNNSCVGTAMYAINCEENESLDVCGNLSVPLSDVNFTGGNLTLVCYLNAQIFSKIDVGLGLSKNITYEVEDRSIVAVEENETTDTDFSWYVNQADEYSPSMWRYVPGLQYGPPEAQTIWGVEQTVAFFVDEEYGENNSNESQNSGAEKKPWDMAYMSVYWDLMAYVEGIIDRIFQPRELYRYIKNHAPVKITDWSPIQTSMTWNATDEEWKTGRVTGPAKVEVDILWGPKPEWPEWLANLQYSTRISWSVKDKYGLVTGGGAWRYVYGSDKPAQTLWGGEYITAKVEKNSTFEKHRFNLVLQAGHKNLSTTYKELGLFTLTIYRKNESNESGYNNSTEITTYYPTWAGAVAYRVIAVDSVEVTPVTEGSITTERMNIGNFVKN
ncbi:MAG: hypothetical protein DRJ60_07750, partial [Thermoprotei archaeon]